MIRVTFSAVALAMAMLTATLSFASDDEFKSIFPPQSSVDNNYGEKQMKKENLARLVPATLEDLSLIQNMSRFYAYDLSRNLGLHYPGWACPSDGLFEFGDLGSFFQGTNKAFLVKVAEEVAGFVMLNKMDILPEIDFNMGEFFILAKFQRTGLAYKVATEVFDTYPGTWSVGVVPEHKKALNFWRKCIGSYTGGNFSEKTYSKEYLKTPKWPDPFPMIIMTFDSRKGN
jgi:predicted acetyltransferase